MLESRNVLNILLLGDAGVGKSSLLSRFLNQKSSGSKPTMGVDYFDRVIAVSGAEVDARFWDTAGAERFRSLSEAYFPIGSGILLVFDVTSKNSFDNLKYWIERIREKCREGIPILIVANKIDLEDKRVVSDAEAIDYSKSIDAFFISASAKTNQNNSVDKAFAEILNYAFEKTQGEQERRTTLLRPSVLLKESIEHEKKSCCN